MKVSLRPLEEADAHTSVAWRNRPEIWLHTAYQPTREISLQDELDWIRHAMTDPVSRRFAIIADGAYIGNVNLVDIQDGEAEYSGFIGEPAYWGRGVGRQASTQAMDCARQLGLQSVRLRVREANLAAMKIYTSLGFTRYGEDERFIHMRLTLTEQQ